MHIKRNKINFQHTCKNAVARRDMAQCQVNMAHFADKANSDKRSQPISDSALFVISQLEAAELLRRGTAHGSNVRWRRSASRRMAAALSPLRRPSVQPPNYKRSDALPLAQQLKSSRFYYTASGHPIFFPNLSIYPLFAQVLSNEM